MLRSTTPRIVGGINSAPHEVVIDPATALRVIGAGYFPCLGL
jgi:hypothetical protein